MTKKPAKKVVSKPKKEELTKQQIQQYYLWFSRLPMCQAGRTSFNNFRKLNAQPYKIWDECRNFEWLRWVLWITDNIGHKDSDSLGHDQAVVSLAVYDVLDREETAFQQFDAMVVRKALMEAAGVRTLKNLYPYPPTLEQIRKVGKKYAARAKRDRKRYSLDSQDGIY